ncbi:MAG: metallophosphoesterase, partial [Actinobacteria bacterium]|nr:metallophosphoesterase [Actinomycetota bacterium]
MERIITWLHLSDLHALSPKHAWEPDFILSELVASLRVFRKRSISPDFIFFSGDLAFGNFSTNPGSSMEDQYHKFDSFFDSVREVFPDVPDQNVFFVPGNHDVDRSEVAVDQQQWLMNSANIEDINNLLQSKDKQFGRLMLRLKEYRQYLESSKYTHLLGDPDRLIYSTKRSIQGIDLGIAGFNSAWASGEDGEKGKLWTGGLWQINNLYNSLSSADLRLALIHHPANWFVEKEDKPFWDTLRSRFHFCLNGHEHSPGVETPVPDFLRIMASACYNRADRLNGYNMTQLNLSTNQACITLLRYDDMGGGWVPHIISGRSTNDGECIIDNVQFLNRLRRRRVFQVPSDMSAGPPPRQPATIPIIQAEPAHLASSIAPSSLRRPPKSGSIWDYIRNICIVEQIDYNQIITRNAIDEEGWESSLFIEPGKYIYQHDYVWDSIKKREPGRILSDHTNSEELLALTRDGKRKGIFLMGDIACGKTTFVTRFSKLYCDTIPQAFCLLEDFSKWRNRINSEEAFQGMM